MVGIVSYKLTIKSQLAQFEPKQEQQKYKPQKANNNNRKRQNTD